MSGIIFFRTPARAEICSFYRDRLGFSTWLEQVGCTILKSDNLLLGFCEGETAETEGVITLVYEDRATVDAMHAQLSDIAREHPEYNDAYDIYQFFADDPEGRTIEFQTFEHETPRV
jgi:hypothetical protein